MRRVAVGVLAAAAATGACAQAASESRGRDMAAELQKRFAAADADHDGRLSRAEAQAGMPFVYRHFDEIDGERKGSVSMREIAAFFRAKSAARKAGS